MKSVTTATLLLLWVCFLAAMVTSLEAADRKALASSNESEQDRLLRQLGSEQFPEREAASKALHALGRSALKTLRKGTASSDPEIRKRSESLIEDVDPDLVALRRLGLNISVNQELPDEPITSVFQEATVIVTDDNLVHLKNFASLTSLSLSGPKISDKGLVHLQGLKNLRGLQLNNTMVTGKGLANLRTLKLLNLLNLSRTKITDDGLKQLQGMDSLRILVLENTAITDAGLGHLKGLTGLLALHIPNTKVTDAGLIHLKGMRHLRILDLSGTGVTDAGLKHLKHLSELWLLFLPDKVTPKALAELTRNLPHLGQPSWQPSER